MRSLVSSFEFDLWLLLTFTDTWNEDNSTNPTDSESETLDIPGAL